MRESFASWQKNRVSHRILNWHLRFLGISGVCFLLFVYFLGIHLAVVLVALMQLGYYVWARQEILKKSLNLKEAAFALDRDFEGHDLFPTLYEIQSGREGIVYERLYEQGERLMEKAHAAEPQIDFDQGFQARAKRMAVVLMVIWLLSLLLMSAGSGSGNSGGSQGENGNSQQNGSSEGQGIQGSDEQNGQKGEEQSGKDGEQARSDQKDGGESESQASSGKPSEDAANQKEQGQSQEMKPGNEKSDASASKAQANEKPQEKSADNQAPGSAASAESSQLPKNNQDPQTVQNQDPGQGKAENSPLNSKEKKPREETDENSKNSGKAAGGGVLAGGEKDEVLNFEDSRRGQKTAFQAPKQKVLSVLSHPRIPRDYKEELKKFFDVKQEFEGDTVP